MQLHGIKQSRNVYTDWLSLLLSIQKETDVYPMESVETHLIHRQYIPVYTTWNQHVHQIYNSSPIYTLSFSICWNIHTRSTLCL